MRWILLAALLLCGARSQVDFYGQIIANNPNAGSLDWTVCGWFYFPTCNDTGVMYSYGNGYDLAAARGFLLAIQTNCQLKMYSGAGVGYASATGAPAVATSTWQHICWTHSSLAANSIWIDATNATADLTVNLADPTIQSATDDFGVFFASDNSSAAEWQQFKGYASQVAYWNTELTGAQIASIADKSTCPASVQTANLKVFLKLNDSPVAEFAQGLSMSTNGTSQVADPTGLPCSSLPAPSTGYLNKLRRKPK